MKFNVHAGHNADGKTACGAIGLIKESTEARKVKDEVIKQLKSLGHTVYDCTCDNSKSASANLTDIVAKCNAHKVNYDISIHFNSGVKDEKGNGRTCGVEVLLYSATSSSHDKAVKVCNSIAALGFTNRGIKIRPELYVLRHTDAPAMLIECCFVDDKDDCNLYDYKKMASAIVKGLTDQVVKEQQKVEEKKEETTYRVQCGAYNERKNAEELVKKLKKAGFDATIVL